MPSSPASKQPVPGKSPGTSEAIRLLIEAGKREEELIEKLSEAVKSGDREIVYTAAKDLVDNHP